MRLRLRKMGMEDWVYLDFSAHEEDRVLDQDALGVMDEIARRMLEDQGLSETWFVERQLAWGEWREVWDVEKSR